MGTSLMKEEASLEDEKKMRYGLALLLSSLQTGTGDKRPFKVFFGKL